MHLVQTEDECIAGRAVSTARARTLRGEVLGDRRRLTNHFLGFFIAKSERTSKFGMERTDLADRSRILYTNELLSTSTLFFENKT